MMKTLFVNGKVIFPTEIAEQDVLVEDGKIAAVGSHLSAGGADIVDVKHQYLSPGFIDIHTHGAGGYDFMDGTAEDVFRACRFHAAHGTTTIVPTAMAASKEELNAVVDLFRQIPQVNDGCPEILGLHLEGPYFAPQQKGAMDPRYLRAPDPEEYMQILGKSDRIARWSFAVELPGAMEFLRALNRYGIITSVAHSDASCSQVEEAFANGLRGVTHFYSAMSTVHRENAFRIAGVVEAGYLIDELFVEVIADGMHLPKELLQLIYKVKGSDKICLVTDSMRAAGMPDGPYILGGKHNGVPCISEGGVAKLPDRTSFAGSVATTDRLVRTMWKLSGAPLYEAVKMAALTPARFMKVDDRKGSISVGKDADIVLFDEHVNVHSVMVRGHFIQ